jgi:hypothetical protein
VRGRWARRRACSTWAGTRSDSWAGTRRTIRPKACEDGTVTDARVAERLRDVGKQVTRFAFLHTNDKTREFLRVWEDSMPNPGGAGR